MTASNFTLPVRVYYEDTDAGGVVYHATYVRFFERARTEYLRQLGLAIRQLTEKAGVLLAVRSLAVEYLRPAFLDDLLHISAYPTAVGRVWVDFQQAATRPADGETVATATVRIVCVRPSPLRAVSLPAALTDKIKL